MAGTGKAAGTSTATGISTFDRTPYEIAIAQRKLSAALGTITGQANTPLPLRAAATEDVEVNPPTAALNITTTAPEVEVRVPVTPTVYPDSPHGTIIVQNQITINIHSAEFIRFDKNLEALIGELHRSNEISGEVREQLVSEMWAGREILGAPKPQRDLIERLLIKPLKWLIEKSGSAMVSKLAGDALEWLLKMLL